MRDPSVRHLAPLLRRRSARLSIPRERLLRSPSNSVVSAQVRIARIANRCLLFGSAASSSSPTPVSSPGRKLYILNSHLQFNILTFVQSCVLHSRMRDRRAKRVKTYKKLILIRENKKLSTRREGARVGFLGHSALVHWPLCSCCGCGHSGRASCQHPYASCASAYPPPHRR